MHTTPQRAHTSGQSLHSLDRNTELLLQEQVLQQVLQQVPQVLVLNSQSLVISIQAGFSDQLLHARSLVTDCLEATTLCIACCSMQHQAS